MPKDYKKVHRSWNEKDLEHAIERIEKGESIRSTATLYGMHEKTLRRKLKDKADEKTGNIQKQPHTQGSFCLVVSRQSREKMLRNVRFLTKDC